MAILVSGGAGYIGSVTVDRLREGGEEVVVLDDLERGHRGAVDEEVPFYQGSVGDRALVSHIVREHDVEACVHFAAYAYVGESVDDPARYFENNVSEGIAFLGALVESEVTRFVFSSTCATYGEPERVPIPEDHPQHPANPYGFTKLVLEQALASYDRAYGFRSAALRYFNAAGATATRGEDHEPESHLIPIVLEVASGRRPHASIFGDDYDTPDGTAIRDYVHVQDLADAHVKALNHLRNDGSSGHYNLGTGRGHSVREVISAAERVTGRSIESRVEGRRPGDPARLVAEPLLAKQVLGWEPQIPDLDAIVKSAWEWHEKHPEGYGD